MIKIASLFKKDVYKNVSFELECGVLCVLSKKPERSSALLDTLVGVRKADGGEITGVENAAYIAKGAPLPEGLTAREYLKLVSGMAGKTYVQPTVEDLTEDIPLEYSISSLTPLERLRLAVAAPMVYEPQLVVIEEPYYGLSAEDYGELKEFIHTVSEFVPVVFSSSSVFESKELSSKTLVLSTGSQIFFGDTETLYGTEINETDVVCIVKGEKEDILSALERYSPEIEETVREGVYCVTVKAVPIFRAAETRGRIKKLLSKARLSLLDISSEKEALLNIIGELSENDKKKRAEIEAKKTEKIKVTKITGSLIAFNHDGEDEESEEEDDTQGEDEEDYSDEE